MTPISPIIKKEIEVRSRRASFASAVAAVSIALFAVSVTGTYSAILRMNELSEARFGLCLRIYILTALVEYALMLLIAPLFTAGAISGERDAGTLDLLLSTGLTPINIVLEKFASAFLSMAVLIISGLPALIVPISFGGVEITAVVPLIASFVPGIFLVLSASIFVSSLSGSVVRSMAVSYAVLLTITAGFVLFAVLTGTIAGGSENIFSYLIIADPLMPVASILAGQTGYAHLFDSLLSLFGFMPDNFIKDNYILISFAADLIAGLSLLILAGSRLMSDRKKKRD